MAEGSLRPANSVVCLPSPENEGSRSPAVAARAGMAVAIRLAMHTRSRGVWRTACRIFLGSLIYGARAGILLLKAWGSDDARTAVAARRETSAC